MCAPEWLRQMAEEMCQFAGAQTETLQTDLSKRDELERVTERLQETSKPVGPLASNTGFGLGQRSVGEDLACEGDALNVTIQVAMVASHAVVDAMVEHGRGIILDVSPMTAHTTVGTYMAYKVWVLRSTEGLAAELAGIGVNAAVLCPGPVHTGFHVVVGIDETQWETSLWLDVKWVAIDSLAAVWRGQAVCTLSLCYRSTDTMLRLALR